MTLPRPEANVLNRSGPAWSCGDPSMTLSRERGWIGAVAIVWAAHAAIIICMTVDAEGD